jgi:Mg2+ and Co2+ transporter CorA
VDAKLRGHLDNLDEMRQRAALLHEEIAARVAEQTNRNTLLMSIVSVIMLPMTFVTGYFGMTTGGLPFNSEVGDGTIRASVAIVLVGIITGIGTWLMLRPPRR